MTIETQAPEGTTEQTPEQVQAEVQEGNEAFSAGFNEERGITPPDEVPARKDEEPAPTPAALIAGLPEAEVKALFEKVPGLEKTINDEIRKVYGKFGEIQGNLQKLRQGQTIRKIDASALERLSADYPEIADMLAEDLNRIFSGVVAQEAKPDAAEAVGKQGQDVNAIVDAAVSQVRETTEKKLLTVLHPDWQTISKEPEFHAWLKTLPGPVKAVDVNGVSVDYPAEAARFLESDDSLVAAECFTKYKAHKAKPGAPSPKQQQNKERLEAAIVPEGSGGVQTQTIDDEQAFTSGFKSVRSGGS